MEQISIKTVKTALDNKAYEIGTDEAKKRAKRAYADVPEGSQFIVEDPAVKDKVQKQFGIHTRETKAQKKARKRGRRC